MMEEKELQQDVLVPLFEAWGFNDVEVHQGTTEVGKDLVMWKSGDLGERLNYAVVVTVVVKAKQVSGKAAGKFSAAEVRLQIEQAFSSEWYDSKTTQAQRADRCFLFGVLGWDFRARFVDAALWQGRFTEGDAITMRTAYTFSRSATLMTRHGGPHTQSGILFRQSHHAWRESPDRSRLPALAYKLQ